MGKKSKLNVTYEKGLAHTPSGLLLPEGASPNMQNIEIHSAYLRRARGVSSYSATSAVGRILLTYNYTKWDNTSFSMLITDDKLYKYNAISDTLTEIGTGYTGVDGRQVIATTFNDLFIFTDFENPLKKSDGSTLSDLGGLSGVKAKAVCPYYSHLILGYVYEGGVTYPSRIKWSDPGDPESYTGIYSGYYDLVDTQDHLVNMSELLGRFHIYKEFTVWEMIYVGGADVYRVSPIINTEGLLAARTLASIKTASGADAKMLLGNNDVYIFDGRSFVGVAGSIHPHLFGTNAVLNKEKVSTSCGAYLPSLGEYWLAIPIEDDVLPYTIYRYNIKENSWWPKRYANPIYSLGVWEEQKEPTWNDLTNDWASSSGVWITPIKGTLISVMGTWDGANGKLKKIDLQSVMDDGSYSVAFWESSDYGGETKGRWVQYQVEVAGGGTLELFYSTDAGNSWYSLGSQAASNEWTTLKWHLNVTSETLRCKLKWGNSDMFVRKQVLHYHPRQR
jgi:hypothetical protein